MEANRIIQGDALSVLKMLPNESVDCVLTSPPYWGLRDYGTGTETIFDGEPNCSHSWKSERIHWHSNRANSKPKEAVDDTFQIKGSNWVVCQRCGAWKGQLGLEPTVDLYIRHLCDTFDEIKRVLKRIGTCWVSLGDTYSVSNNGSNDRREKDGLWLNPQRRYKGQKAGKAGLPAKCLCLISFRFPIEMANRGWILRNTIIWHKPNCMPSSVKDRFTGDFEYLFFFAKSQSYWFEQQLEPPVRNSDVSYRAQLRVNTAYCAKPPYQNKFPVSFNLSGRNKRSVWTIPTAPFPEAHFATFPEALFETPINAGCPEFICTKCGVGRRKLYDGKSAGAFNIRVRDVKKGRIKHADRRASREEVLNYDESEYGGGGKRFLGYTDCSCGAPFTPGVVLDPFFGSGTTGVSALKLNRTFIGIDLNPQYIAIAKKRIAAVISDQTIAPIRFDNETTEQRKPKAA